MSCPKSNYTIQWATNQPEENQMKRFGHGVWVKRASDKAGTRVDGRRLRRKINKTRARRSTSGNNAVHPDRLATSTINRSGPKDNTHLNSVNKPGYHNPNPP